MRRVAWIVPFLALALGLAGCTGRVPPRIGGPPMAEPTVGGLGVPGRVVAPGVERPVL